MPSLICNAENRLGRGGAGEVKNHGFFCGVDFDSLCQIQAPFKPKLVLNVDTTYFPINEISQVDTVDHLRAVVVVAAENEQTRDEAVELSLPFLGYTFKLFETNHS